MQLPLCSHKSHHLHTTVSEDDGDTSMKRSQIQLMVVALISFRTRDYLSSPALLPHDFHNNNNNNNIILEALSFIMNNKTTEFEDRFIKQLCGTAMGTSVAVMYNGLYYGSHLYYGWHEKIRLLPGYSEEIQDLHDSSTIYLSYGSAA